MEGKREMNNAEYNKAAVEKANRNHIYLNAFNCISPSPEFEREVGRFVLDRLKNRDNLMPDNGIASENELVRFMAERSPVLYLKISKS